VQGKHDKFIISCVHSDTAIAHACTHNGVSEV